MLRTHIFSLCSTQIVSNSNSWLSRHLQLDEGNEAEISKTQHYSKLTTEYATSAMNAVSATIESEVSPHVIAFIDSRPLQPAEVHSNWGCTPIRPSLVTAPCWFSLCLTLNCI